FVGADALDGERVTLRGDQARQIATVLRLARGARVVAVHEGEELETVLDAVTPSEVTGHVTERRRSQAELPILVTLALPLLRGDHSEEVIEAVTQLGVSRIQPFTSERSVARELSAAKRSRWERIAQEAAETAKRGRVPAIGDVLAWSDLFGSLGRNVVVAWEEERETPLRAGLRADGDVSLVIGPEGGLTANEIAWARQRGATVVSLGPRTLRSETAAVVAVAQLLALRGL
ncbi:MAG: 16S rRNA (uracil(1498)-N(3))-methyltransferase, partial [Chloroflexi bacterium]|nr:16S rRNA (uracil(1498)-N(3))-methyltransferase [Chloroflexota bacterium]